MDFSPDKLLDSMHWTMPSAIGFAALFVLLIVLTLLDLRWPSHPRKGLLPMPTTRGDRVFLAIALFLSLVFLWLKLAPDVSAWWPVSLAALVAPPLLRWG